jgi:hypothetical protein
LLNVSAQHCLVNGDLESIDQLASRRDSHLFAFCGFGKFSDHAIAFEFGKMIDE